MADNMNASNAAQIEFWNGEVGRKWAAEQDDLDAMLSPLGLGGIAKANFAKAEQVIDVGCGCGQTTLAIASLIGPDGKVTGIDISEPMLARARSRAEKTDNIVFTLADASSYKFTPGSVDLVFSRFGVMFFADPTVAFRNVRSALKPGGRVCLVVWRSVKENPWVLKSLMVAGKFVTLPAPLGPEDPGPFSFADAARVKRIMESAGFKDVHLAPQDVPLTICGGRTLSEAVDFLAGVGPIRGILAEQTPDMRAQIRNAIEIELAPEFGPQGLRMASATWLVTARN